MGLVWAGTGLRYRIVYDREIPAGHIRVSNMLWGAFTDSSSSIILTDSSLSTWAARARVKQAVCVGVTSIAWLALAHCCPEQ